MIEIVSIHDGGRWLPKSKSVVSDSGVCVSPRDAFREGNSLRFDFFATINQFHGWNAPFWPVWATWLKLAVQREIGFTAFWGTYLRKNASQRLTFPESLAVRVNN
jgi:hypothetical protein